MRYPIGVQSFEKIRKDGLVYVDKTDLVYKLTDENRYVFLGRPRRFGKSLLLSTIEEYFQGRKDLFEGLAIERLEKEWIKHPVLHFDLNIGKYDSLEGLYEIIDAQLIDYEVLYGRYSNSDSPQLRLRWLIKQAYEQTGSPVVILVDEYDKPVLQAIDNPNLDKAFREVLKPFYGVLKSEDKYIRFGMLTGVSKFGKLSVFSDLNNIKDISLLPDYSAICGITQKEVTDYFSEPIAEFAQKLNISEEEVVDKLRQQYDGYRFTSSPVKVFNPYSLLNAFADKELNDYWFESGTPTFLVKLLQQRDYDLSKISGVEVDERSLYMIENVSAIPLLYQSGYLTIKDYDPEERLCALDYPNREVESGFFNFLLPFYSDVQAYDTKSELSRLTKEIKSGDVEGFMSRLKDIFYSIPYAKNKSAKVQEDNVRNLIYLLFKLIGMRIHVECQMSTGRSDAVVMTHSHIYVFEFKVNSTPEKAIKQILDKHYAEPYRHDGRTVILIGVNYSTKERAITAWKKEPSI